MEIFSYNILELIIIVAAAWRLTSLFVQEEGPFMMFLVIRYIMGVRYFTVESVIDPMTKRATRGDERMLSFKELMEVGRDNEYDHYYMKAKNVTAKAISCQWCFSIYVAAFFIVLMFIGQNNYGVRDALMIFSSWLALSAFSLMFNNKLI